MNTAEMIEVTDRDYKPNREEILSYPSRTFSEDIGEYILKFKENDDLQAALKEMWEWDRMLVSGRNKEALTSYQDWEYLSMSGSCVRENIYRIGKIIYRNFLASTEAK